ncbi:MAG: tetratricopeptide repeat protein [Pyrinomonadaceae bacterium]
MIGETVSHYRILSLLGEGGMGTVYLAEDTQLGRRVALKIPNTPAAEQNQYHGRFLREARSASALSHPNIATLYDYGETADGKPFLVMELVEGKELGELIESESLTIQRAVEIVCDVARALAAAHARGIVHRDIKPSNVVVNERGEVKVLDFGLAKLVGTERLSSSATPEAQTLQLIKTRSDVMIGTPLYLSPEQAKGTDVDGRSDLFALGALLYECVAGRPAFSGSTVVEIAAQVLHVDPPPPSKFNPQVPRALDRVVVKALAKRPEDRYQSADEFVAALDATRPKLSTNGHARTQTVRRSADASTVSHSAITTLSENLRRPRVSLITVAACVAAAILFVWGVSRLLRPRPHAPAPEAAKLHDLGLDFLREGAYWQASKNFQRAVEIDPDFALAHARLAEAWSELDYLDRAKDEMLRVHTLVPDSSALGERDRLYLEGVTATVTRDFAVAVKAYGEIARANPRDPYAFLDLGRAYEKADDLPRAVENYLKATGLKPDYAAAYLRVGNLYSRQQDYKSAEAAYDTAQQIYEATGVNEGRAELLVRRGTLLRNESRLAEARKALEDALSVARANGYEMQQVNALLQLSLVAIAENDPAAARARANDALSLAQSKGMDSLAAMGLVNLGIAAYSNSDYPEAEKYLRQGFDLAERNKAARARAWALVNLGSMRIQQGAIDEGVGYVRQALAFYQPGNYRNEVLGALALLARVERQKGNFAQALDALRQQLDVAEKAGDQSLVARAHAEIGRLLATQQDYPGALAQFDDGYRIQKSLGDELGAAYAQVGRADALAPLGRYDEARDALALASAVADKPGAQNKELAANLRLTEAQIALASRDFAGARAKCAEAVALVGAQSKVIAAQAKLVEGLAQVYAGAGAAGAQTCRSALDAAKGIGDSSLYADALLAYAEALLASGDAQGAQTKALDAEGSFEKGGQRESAWRAWLVAAQAAARANRQDAAREYAARAASALDDLHRAWGDEAFNTYQARRDVQLWHKQLDELSAASRAA